MPHLRRLREQTSIPPYLNMQTDIFGGTSTQPIHPQKLAREIMEANPMTFRSHRLLMREVAAKLGFPWDKLTKEQQHLLEDLLNLSPDFERAARKVREEDSAMQRG